MVLPTDRSPFDTYQNIFVTLVPSFTEHAIESWQAKVIDGHLFLRSRRILTLDWSGDPSQAGGVVITADSRPRPCRPGYDRGLKFSYGICQHLDYSDYFTLRKGHEAMWNIEEVQDSETTNGRCELCLTEYYFSSQEVSQTCMEQTLETYHCLGTLNSVTDPQWLCASTTGWHIGGDSSDYWELCRGPPKEVTAPLPRKSWDSSSIVEGPVHLYTRQLNTRRLIARSFPNTYAQLLD